MRIDAQFLGLDRTGGIVVLFRYLAALRDAGHDVSITSLGTDGDRRFLPAPANVPVAYLGLRGPAYRALVRTIPGGLHYPSIELGRLRRAAPPVDLRLATYSFTVLSAIDAGAAVHHHVQHYEALLEPTERRRRLVDMALNADVYRTANCTWVADRIVEAGGDVQGIVPPAIDHEVFTVTGRAAPACEDPTRPLRIMTLGKAIDWKGLVDVVAGTRSAARHLGPVELHSYGQNPPKVPADLPSVHHGLVDAPTLAELYRSSDISVTASWYESFPLPPIEAMASGTAVICTRLGTEDYAVHEQNCLIVPAREPDAIAAAVQRLARDGDLRRELVANGIATAQRFQWADSERLFVQHAEHAAGVRV